MASGNGVVAIKGLKATAYGAAVLGNAKTGVVVTESRVWLLKDSQIGNQDREGVRVLCGQYSADATVTSNTARRAICIASTSDTDGTYDSVLAAVLQHHDVASGSVAARVTELAAQVASDAGIKPGRAAQLIYGLFLASDVLMLAPLQSSKVAAAKAAYTALVALAKDAKTQLTDVIGKDSDAEVPVVREMLKALQRTYGPASTSPASSSSAAAAQLQGGLSRAQRKRQRRKASRELHGKQAEREAARKRQRKQQHRRAPSSDEESGDSSGSNSDDSSSEGGAEEEQAAAIGAAPPAAAANNGQGQQAAAAAAAPQQQQQLVVYQPRGGGNGRGDGNRRNDDNRRRDRGHGLGHRGHGYK